jgi:hypothetical protein
MNWGMASYMAESGDGESANERWLHRFAAGVVKHGFNCGALARS